MICRQGWSELLHQIGMGGEYLHAVEIGISLQERCLNEMVAVVLNRRNFLINVPDSFGVGRLERVILRCGALAFRQCCLDIVQQIRAIRRNFGFSI